MNSFYPIYDHAQQVRMNEWAMQAIHTLIVEISTSFDPNFPCYGQKVRRICWILFRWSDFALSFLYSKTTCWRLAMYLHVPRPQKVHYKNILIVIKQISVMCKKESEKSLAQSFILSKTKMFMVLVWYTFTSVILKKNGKEFCSIICIKQDNNGHGIEPCGTPLFTI